MSILDKTESSTASYHLKDNVLIMRIKEDADITLDAAIEGVEARKKLQKDNQVLLLVDMRKVGQVHREARDYAAQKEIEEMNKAMGLLAGKSLPAVMMGNFFIKFNKPKVPTKLFRSEEKALAWLETHR